MTDYLLQKHKALIYTAIIPVLAIFSYLANYAMIFRETASVVSYLSVLGATGWIIYQFLNKKTTKKSFGILIAFLSLYTLHRGFIFSILLLSYFVDRKQSNKKPSEATVDSVILTLLPEILLTGTSFLIMDIAREYSVWHEWVFRTQPLIGFAVSCMICLLYMVKKSDHSS